MSNFFHRLQDERWARTIGVLAGLVTGALGIISNSESWQVAVFALIPFLFGFVTERRVYSEATVRDIGRQDY